MFCCSFYCGISSSLSSALHYSSSLGIDCNNLYLRSGIRASFLSSSLSCQDMFPFSLLKNFVHSGGVLASLSRRRRRKSFIYPTRCGCGHSEKNKLPPFSCFIIFVLFAKDVTITRLVVGGKVPRLPQKSNFYHFLLKVSYVIVSGFKREKKPVS